jgi:hypothetical protein
MSANNTAETAKRFDDTPENVFLSSVASYILGQLRLARAETASYAATAFFYRIMTGQKDELCLKCRESDLLNQTDRLSAANVLDYEYVFRVASLVVNVG